VKRKLPSRRLTYQQERDATILWKREKPSNRRQTIWSRLLEFLDSGERIRRKTPPKTNKEASCGQIPNPEFSDWPERQKIAWRKSNLKKKPWKHMQVVHKFLVRPKNGPETTWGIRTTFYKGLGNEAIGPSIWSGGDGVGRCRRHRKIKLS